MMVSDYTLFPLWLDAKYIETFREQTRFLDRVNIVPLKGLSLEYLLSVQGWGNVLLGMPWGFGFPFVVPISGWRATLRAGAIFAASIELTQLAISLLYGFAYRVIDINDFLLNLAGVASGYAILSVLAKGIGPKPGRRANTEGQPTT